MFCGIKLEGCIYIDWRIRVFNVHLPFKLFFVSLPFPKFHAHTHSNNFLIQRFQISFDIYRPSIYMIRLTAGMDGIPGLFYQSDFQFDNIIFLFFESKYNWKILSTFLKNHFAILLNICHLIYENNIDLISFTFCRCLMVYFTLMFSIKFIHTHCMNICT